MTEALWVMAILLVDPHGGRWVTANHLYVDRSLCIEHAQEDYAAGRGPRWCEHVESPMRTRSTPPITVGVNLDRMTGLYLTRTLRYYGIRMSPVSRESATGAPEVKP